MAITGAGTYNDYAYTGGIQTFTVPITGLYQLETWGAAGGSWNTPIAKGGYSKGCKILTKGEILYIVCGGIGNTAVGSSKVANGGYNGGGAGYGNGGEWRGTGGGGATHIATRSGILSSLSGHKSTILLVAGGGGGGSKQDSVCTGGTGGGNAGGNASGSFYNTAKGGTQSNGGAGYDIYTESAIYTGSFGQGGNCKSGADVITAGGGGGYYGGGAAYYGAGGGGSGYTGGVPAIIFSGVNYTPSTSNDNNVGAGRARILLVKVQSNIKFNNTTAEKVIYNGKTVDKVVFNGTLVFG